VSCLACDLIEGRVAAPGGTIAARDGWIVDHCIGPLGVGSLIVKPRRHVVTVAELVDSEASALGPTLRDTARVVHELAKPDQIYVCLWSHADGIPRHIHSVVQPVSSRQLEEFQAHGPALQLVMFEHDEPPDWDKARQFAERARTLFQEAAPRSAAEPS
jgi:diadenosine tetraphosphate (Ap4A) HIT family hydrolase